MEKMIQEYLKKPYKTAIVLRMLMTRPYITNDDIINIYRMSNPKCKHSFSTNPQKFIETLRKRFGYDFILDEDIPFTTILHTLEGKTFKVTDTYKKYFLNKMQGGINAA